MTTIVRSLVLLGIFASVATVRAEDQHDGVKVAHKCDKALAGKKYAQAAECYEKAKTLLGPSKSLYLDLGNAYAAQGKYSIAIDDYLRAYSLPIEQNADIHEKCRSILPNLGKDILACATCSWNLPHWQALVTVQTALGNGTKAALADQELQIHRQANAAFEKAVTGGTMGWLATGLTAVSQGMSGQAPPSPALTVDDIAMTREWQAKIAVYQKHGKTAYVAEATEMMRQDATEANQIVGNNTSSPVWLQINSALKEILSSH